MASNLENALTIFIIIILGFIFRRLRLVNQDTAKSLSYLVIYMTLPCAIVSSANGIEFDISLMSIMLLAVLFNIVLLIVGFFCFKNAALKVFTMINITCFNIGNFTIPFMQSIVSAKAFLAICMFDMINALFCFGGCYAIAIFVNRKNFSATPLPMRAILKEISRSMPVYAYLISLSLSALAISLPSFILTPLSAIGKANTLLCIVVIGMLINLKINKSQLARIAKLALIRYTVGLILCVFIYYCLPYEFEIKFVLMVIALAPVPSVAPIFTMKALPQMAKDSANLNTVSILISIVMVTLLNALSPLLSQQW